MCGVRQSKKKPRRSLTSIELSPEDREIVNTFLRPYGGKMQKQALGRLIQWFAAQAPSVKQAVLGWTPEDMNKQYAKLFRDMADKFDPPKGTRALIVTNDVYRRLEQIAGKRSPEDYVAEHAVTRTKDLEIGQPKGAGHEEQTSSQSSR
jgi:predicted CopG family antitoxin